MPSLPEADRLALLQLARSTITEFVTKGTLPDVPSQSIFAERRGVFVTLHIDDRLRGCIGVLDGRQRLGEAVVHCAAGAAREDPRFPPVQANELEAIRVELSTKVCCCRKSRRTIRWIASDFSLRRAARRGCRPTHGGNRKRRFTGLRRKFSQSRSSRAARKGRSPMETTSGGP